MLLWCSDVGSFTFVLRLKLSGGHRFLLSLLSRCARLWQDQNRVGILNLGITFFFTNGILFFSNLEDHEIMV
jgi:hypothetical protein